MAWACVGPVDAVPNAAVPTPIAALRLIKLRRLRFFLSCVDPESPTLFLDILISLLGNIDRDFPRWSPNRREFLRFSDLPTRQSWDADSYPHRGRPERRSSGKSGRLRWHFDALLPSVALERMTVERLMLSQAEAAARLQRVSEGDLDDNYCLATFRLWPIATFAAV